jgi:protein TonB
MMRQVVLLESGRRRSRPTPAAGVVSVVLHGGLILLAVVATAEGSRGVRDPQAESRIHFARPLPTRQAAPVSQRSPARRQTADAQAVPRLNPSPVPSFQIPDVLPVVDAPLFDPSVQAELRELAESGSATGVSGLSSGAPDGAYTRHEVEEPAATVPGLTGPRYPESLQRARVEGRVRVRFVVGVDGRADGAPVILFATRSEFAASVREFLARARYRPARIGGKAVPQLVEQEFIFELRT